MRRFLSLSGHQKQPSENFGMSSEYHEELERIEEQLATLNSKEEPSNKELMEFLSLATKRTDIKTKAALDVFETQVIPKIVQREMKKEAPAMEESILHQLRTTLVDDLSLQIDSLNVSLQETKTELEQIKRDNRASKDQKMIKFCRDIAIKEVETFVTLLGVPAITNEGEDNNDPNLGQEVHRIMKQISPDYSAKVVGWKRIGKPSAKEKPRPIIIDVGCKKTREAIISKARNTTWKVKRTIPNILMDEFKELSKIAKETRDKDGSHCYVGWSRGEIFLRTRKDERSPWKTTQRR